MAKVVMVHASADLYGSDLACLRIARGAREAGWAVEVTVPTDGPLVAELMASGAAVRFIDPLKLRRADLQGRAIPRTAARWAREAASLARMARDGRADLVYTTTAPTFGGAWLARRWGVGHVYHVHEIFWQPRPAVRAFERVLATTDAVLCCSRAVLEQFRSPAVRARGRVVHTGAEVPGDLEPPLPLSGPATEVVCVARLNEWKGQEILVEAAARLAADVPGLHVRLVGDVYGDEHHYRHALENQIAALGLQGVVTLEGERRDALRIVAGSDIFVLPSRRPEPFGMALVEAMALGRPVVATAAGGPLEIVTDGVDGLLVPPGDPLALAGAIRRLVGDPAWARSLGTSAVRRAHELTSDSMIRGVLATFDEVLRTPRAHRR